MNILLASLSIGTIIDIVVICILIIMLLLGLRVGFVKSIISTFGTLISVLVAVMFCTQMTDFLQQKFALVTAIGDKLGGALSTLFSAETMDTPLSSITSDSLTQFGIAGFLASIVLKIKGSEGVDLSMTLNQVLCPTVSFYICCALSVIILFFLSKILLFIIGKLVERLQSIKVIGFTDKLLGCLFGLLKGIIIIQILIFTINLIPISIFKTIDEGILSAPVCSFIKSFNLFSYIAGFSFDISKISDYILSYIGSI